MAFTVRQLKISSLPDAEKELARIGVDPTGISSIAPKMLSSLLHIRDLECRQANILKQEMLSLGGDAAVARGSVSCSIEKTDLILIGTLKQLKRLCDKLKAQPFRLPELSDNIKLTLDRINSGPRVWRTARRDLPLERPLIMGILNVTPDSFSDGALYMNLEAAMAKALKMIEEGADIIDVGGESTRPDARPVSASEEISRVIPVIRELSKKTSSAVSIDTWKGDVAAAAVEAGAEIINDISGFTFDPKMPGIAAETGAAAVLMHTRGEPATMHLNTHYDDLLSDVAKGLYDSLKIAGKAGVDPERICIDPGIGFAKGVEANLELIRRLEELSGFGHPLMIGVSRKSFIGKSLGRNVDERTYGTAAAVALSVANGADIIRVHDVAAMRDAAFIAHAVSRAGRSGCHYSL